MKPKAKEPAKDADAPKDDKPAEEARGRARRRAGRPLLRRLSVQEGSLSPADLRGRAERAANGSARRRIQRRSPGALFRRRARGGSSGQMARGAVSLCVHAAGARGFFVFDRRALFRRRQVQIDRRVGARPAHRRRRRRAHEFRHDHRADGAAAPLFHRGHRHRRRRHRGAQCAECDRRAALRARRQDATLCRAARRHHAGTHRH